MLITISNIVYVLNFKGYFIM